MKKSLFSLLLIFFVVWLLPQCEMLPTEIQGGEAIDELDVVINLDVENQEIRVVNYNSDGARVIVSHRVYGGSEKYTVIFDEYVYGARGGRNACVKKNRLISGDKYCVEIKVSGNEFIGWYTL